MSTSMVWARPSWRQAWRAAGVMLLGVALAACGGGGGDSGTSVFDPGTGTSPNTPSTLADLAVVADKTSVPNSGAEVVTFTITALTSGNAALTGVETPVTVEVDSGSIVTPSAKVTSKDTGKITAVVQIIDKTSRVVTVTAKSGSFTKKQTFNVVDSKTGSLVADLSVVVDKPTIANTGTEEAKITVTALDAARSAQGGVAVALEIVDVAVGPEGRAVILDPDQTTTSTATGQLTRRLKLQNNKTKRTIAVKATSGTVSRTVTIDVVDPPAGTVLVASDLILVLNKTSIGNGGSESVDVTVTALDVNRNSVKDIDVTFEVNGNAVLIPGNTKTDAAGQAKAKVEIGSDRSKRQVMVTVRAGTLVRVKGFEVTGPKLLGTAQPATLNAGAPGEISYTLVDVNSNPMSEVPITVSGPGTASGSGVTDLQGKWTYKYTAQGSNSMPITASAGGVSLELAVQVNAKVPEVPASVKVLSATMTVDPIVVKVNSPGRTDNRAEIRLLFRGEKNAPLENVRARIGLGPNSSSTDGRFSVGDKEPIVYSDKNGVAVLSFIAGERYSPNEQVKIYGCYGRKDDLGDTAGGCLNGFSITPAQITIVESPISISIGGDDKIEPGATGLTYIEKLTVLVVDSAGNPKPDVQITPTLDLTHYGKGEWRWSAVEKKWYQYTFFSCPAEDALEPDGKRNGTIEANEDRNNNGQLDPRQSDVSIALVGSTKTDSNGLATLRIEFPKGMASWVRYVIRVSAPGVLSPPAWYGKFDDRWTSPTLDSVKSEGTPAYVYSPYGRVLDCSSPY